MRVVAIFLPGVEDLNFFAEACLRWSPQVALGKESIFLEVEKCLRLHTEKDLVADIQSFIKDWAPRANLRVANDIPTALSLARFCVPDKQDLPVEALTDFLNPFCEIPSLEKMILALKNLGLHRLCELTELRPREISSRFGKEGLFAALRVRDASHIPWPWFKVQEKVEETRALSTEQGVKTLQPLMFIIKGLLERAMARLSGRGEKALKIRVLLEQENYSTVTEVRRSYEQELTFPSSSSEVLLPLLKERLDWELRKEPLEAPLISVSVEVSESVRAVAPQSDFFDKREEQKEVLDALVNRLCQRLGPSQTFWAKPAPNHRPEEAWKKVRQPEVNKAYRLPQRPLRLLQSPQPLYRRGPLLNGKSGQWRVKQFSGPESISGEWWGDLFDRDYYRVDTESGEKLWVFKTGSKLFLHGFFD